MVFNIYLEIGRYENMFRYGYVYVYMDTYTLP